MNVGFVEQLKQAFCGSLSVLPREDGRFVLDTPFTVAGGDHVPLVVQPAGDGWELTDDGETFMQLDLIAPGFEQGRRWRVIESVLASRGVRNQDGELVIRVDREAPAESIASFIQAVIEVMEVRHWTRDTVRARTSRSSTACNSAPTRCSSRTGRR